MTRGRAPSGSRELALYSGTRMLGTILIRGKRFEARTVDGKSISKYADQKSASAALAQLASSVARLRPSNMNGRDSSGFGSARDHHEDDE
jgi:hypothetical protein